MTTTHVSASFSGGRTVRPTRVGKWTYTPHFAPSTGRESATLHDGSRCIDLRYSSGVLEEFLRTMSGIQAEFDRLARGREEFTAPARERTGQARHV